MWIDHREGIISRILVFFSPLLHFAVMHFTDLFDLPNDGMILKYTFFFKQSGNCVLKSNNTKHKLSFFTMFMFFFHGMTTMK